MLDKTLSHILETLQPENHLGVLLAAQMGGTPQEIQLIMQTAIIDDSHESLQPTGQYIIRAVGVQEHRLAMGLFANFVHSIDNVLLHPHNEPIVELRFSGTPDDIDALLIDINQLYAQTYGIFDPFRRMADELNPTAPLATILESGEGLLGVMAQPFAYRLGKVLANHNLTPQYTGAKQDEDHSHADITYKLLVLDDSYLVAQMFSADPMGNPNGA